MALSARWLELRSPEGESVDIDCGLSVELQRALCAINRTVFKLSEGGEWKAPARGTTDLVLAPQQVSELRRQGLVDVASNSILVPTELGRQSYRACANRGHSKHLER